MCWKRTDMETQVSRSAERGGGAGQSRVRWSETTFLAGAHGPTLFLVFGAHESQRHVSRALQRTQNLLWLHVVKGGRNHGHHCPPPPPSPPPLRPGDGWPGITYCLQRFSWSLGVVGSESMCWRSDQQWERAWEEGLIWVSLLLFGLFCAGHCAKDITCAI